MKKILGLLLALALIVSGCNSEPEKKEKDKKKEKEVVECTEIEIEFSYEEGEEKEFIENALAHYEEVRDNNGIYNINSYAPVRNEMLDLYEVYNSFQVFEDCVKVGMLDGFSSGYSYAKDDSYDSSIIYVIEGKDKVLYEFETSSDYDIEITDEFDDEDKYDKMYDSINAEVLDKYFDDIVEAVEDESDSSFDYQTGYVVVSTKIDTKEYGEIPLVVNVSGDGKTLIVLLYSEYNNDYLTDQEKDAPMEFYVTYGTSNDYYDMYEELRDDIKDFED